MIVAMQPCEIPLQGLRFLSAIIIYISNSQRLTIVHMNANLFANITQKLRLTIAGALIFDV
jgi:hypothetical protein